VKPLDLEFARDRYHGTWNSTDQVPERALTEGLVGRFGSLDPSDGGDTYRYSGSLDWQRGTAQTLTKVSAYGIGYGLNLFSDFTYAFTTPFMAGPQIHRGRYSGCQRSGMQR